MIENRLRELWRDLQGKKTASTAFSIRNPLRWYPWIQ